MKRSILTHTWPIWWEGSATGEREGHSWRAGLCSARRQEEFHAPRSGRLYPRDYLQLIRPCCLLSRFSIGSSSPIALPLASPPLRLFTRKSNERKTRALSLSLPSSPFRPFFLPSRTPPFSPAPRPPAQPLFARETNRGKYIVRK